MKKNMPRIRAMIQGNGKGLMKRDDVSWLQCFTMLIAGQAEFVRLAASILAGCLIGRGVLQ